MQEIGETDAPGIPRPRARDAAREPEKNPRQRFIDEVWPGAIAGMMQIDKRESVGLPLISGFA